MPSESEPPNSAAETTGDDVAGERLTGQSPVRFHRSLSPKTPRTRAYFAAGGRHERPVSAPPDYMAVSAVQGELVSAGISLICRENAGKSSRIRPGWPSDSRNFLSPTKSQRLIPYD